MIKQITLLFATFCVSETSLAQVAGRNTAPVHTAFLELAASGQAYALDAAPQALVKELNLTSADAFVRLSTGRDQRGGVHERYAQYYRHVPVEGGLYLVHAQRGQIQNMNGHFERIQDLNVTPAVPEDAALAQALRTVGARQYGWQESPLQSAADTKLSPPKGALVIVSDATPGLTISQPTLAWKFDVYALQPRSWDYVYVDAQSGKLLGRVNQAAHSLAPARTIATAADEQPALLQAHCYASPLATTAAVPATAETYHHGQRKMWTDYDLKLNSYILHDYSSTPGNWDIRTIGDDQKGGYRDFTDPDNYWQTSVTPLFYSATDIHWGTRMTDDFFRNVLHRNSYDDNGGPILNIIADHGTPGGAITYLVPTNNGPGATIPGTAVRFRGIQIEYAYGIDTAHPTSTIDMVAHEYGHAINRFSAQLGTGSTEDGALNEGLSDIWGACLTAYIGEQSLMWRFMERIATPGTARLLDQPKRNNCPDTYGPSGLYYSLRNDRFKNATILSHWFYLLSEGGSGVNDAGINYTVNGIGWRKAADIIFLTETRYMLPTTNFCQAAELTRSAAYNLYGLTGPELQAVSDAWKAVNVCYSGSRMALKGPTPTESPVQADGLYPNPTGDAATIALSKIPAAPVRASIYNDQGRVVKTVLLDGANTAVNLQELTPGLYYLRYKESGKAKSQTFRIER